MSKNLDLKQLMNYTKPVVSFVQKYAAFMFFIAILLAYSFLVFRISVLTQSEPSDDAVNEQLKTVKRLKIDQNSIDKINQLEDQNIGVQSLFESARDNPFQD